MNGEEITLPKEGDEMVENSKTYVWTKRVDGTCTIHEWVEKPTYQTQHYDYSNFMY